MSITLNVQSDIAKLLNPIYELSARQYPFIVALTLTRTAKEAEKAVIEQMDKTLDRPTPFTKRGTKVKPATKQTLEAEVDLRDFGFKGGTSREYLQPQILGGPRRSKRFEMALRAAGVLPDGLFVVPGRGAQLDQYGNVAPRGVYAQVLSALRASPDQYQNRTAGSIRRRGRTLKQYFVINTSNRLPMGIYERRGRTVALLFAFVKQPNYKARYPFYETANKRSIEVFPTELAKATKRAIETAFRR